MTNTSQHTHARTHTHTCSTHTEMHTTKRTWLADKSETQMRLQHRGERVVAICPLLYMCGFQEELSIIPHIFPPHGLHLFCPGDSDHLLNQRGWCMALHPLSGSPRLFPSDSVCISLSLSHSLCLSLSLSLCLPAFPMMLARVMRVWRGEGLGRTLAFEGHYRRSVTWEAVMTGLWGTDKSSSEGEGRRMSAQFEALHAHMRTCTYICTH